MAAFREHIAFSSLLGVGYGACANALLGFTPVEATLAGFLAGCGGMLPDLDSPKARPGQEIFSLLGAISPLVLVGHVLRWLSLPSDTETVILVMVGIYFTVRYGGAWVVDKLSVHRGMFHSIPAMVIAAEIAFLAYPTPRPLVKLLMGAGVALGFFSHLFLDEVYSVKWTGMLPELKKSFGTAIKFTSEALMPTVFTYGLLATLTFVIGEQTGLIGPPVDPKAAPIAEEHVPAATDDPFLRSVSAPPVVEQASVPSEQLTDAPLFR